MNDILKTIVIFLVLVTVGLACSSFSGKETNNNIEKNEQEVTEVDYTKLKKSLFCGWMFLVYATSF